jgi:aldehyde dehydrogenase (NAD+)
MGQAVFAPVLNAQHQAQSWWAGGQWIEASGDTCPMITPIDGRTIIGNATLAGPADMAFAVSGACLAMPHAFALDLTARRGALLALSTALLDHKHALAELITLENGCPARQSLALQVESAAGVLKTFASLCEPEIFEENRPAARGGRVIIQKLPIGVAAGIVPWNVPLFLSAMKLGAAIATGCPLVLKPAPETALSAYILAKLVSALDLPAGMISVLAGDRDAGAALVGDLRVMKVSFTGSSAGGVAVARACVDRLARVTLELGGKSAAILLDDVDMDAIASELRLATLQNNGQVCGAQSRILVPRARFGEISEVLAANYKSQIIGDPRNLDTDIGPLASETQRARVQGAIDDAKAQGATFLSGQDRPNLKNTGLENGAYVAPTLVGPADPGLALAREEVFGPVTCLIPYESEDEAVALSDASPYGLSGSVWSADSDRALQIARRLRTGTVGLNTKRILDFSAPFGGMRGSGLGRELGLEGLNAWLEMKTILLPNA